MLMGLGDRRHTLQAEPTTELRIPIFRKQRVYCPGVLVVEGPKWQESDPAIDQLLNESCVQPFRIVCLVDDADDCVRDDASFLWTVFTRFEPASDIHAKRSLLERFHVQMSAPILIDCRLKPWFPPVVEPSPETISRVDALWPKIFP
jgi:3-polyprenyl-4-hydroxybenzoate decarboxylase